MSEQQPAAADGLFGPGIFGTGIDVSALDETTAFRLGIWIGQQIVAARAEGYAEAQSNIFDACLAQRDMLAERFARPAGRRMDGRRAGLEEAAHIAMATNLDSAAGKPAPVADDAKPTGDEWPATYPTDDE